MRRIEVISISVYLKSQSSSRSSDLVNHKPSNKRRKCSSGLQAQPLIGYLRNECYERRQGQLCAEIKKTITCICNCLTQAVHRPAQVRARVLGIRIAFQRSILGSTHSPCPGARFVPLGFSPAAAPYPTPFFSTSSWYNFRHMSSSSPGVLLSDNRAALRGKRHLCGPN